MTLIIADRIEKAVIVKGAEAPQEVPARRLDPQRCRRAAPDRQGYQGGIIRRARRRHAAGGPDVEDGRLSSRISARQAAGQAGLSTAFQYRRGRHAGDHADDGVPRGGDNRHDSSRSRRASRPNVSPSIGRQTPAAAASALGLRPAPAKPAAAATPPRPSSISRTTKSASKSSCRCRPWKPGSRSREATRMFSKSPSRPPPAPAGSLFHRAQRTEDRRRGRETQARPARLLRHRFQRPCRASRSRGAWPPQPRGSARS